MGIISRMFNKSAQISLVREEQVFYLLAYYDEELSSINMVAEKWPELQGIAERVGNNEALRNVIPISQFQGIYSYIKSLKDQCANNKKLSFFVPVEIEGVDVRSKAPEWFVVTYQRQQNTLVRVLPEGVIELDEGWLRYQNTYWKYDKLDVEALNGLKRTTIPMEEWVSFVKTDLPIYRAAGVKIESQIEYDERAALKLELLNYDEEAAEIHVTWGVPQESIDESIQLNEHVLAMSRIWPGLMPSVVKKVFPQETNHLKSQQLASFLDNEYKDWKKWFTTYFSEFEKIHSWIEPPFAWELCARSKISRGVGKAYAYPVACIGKNKLEVEDLKKALCVSYTRLQDGWVRKEDLLTLGMNEDGYRSDGSEIKPIRLDAQMLLHGGGRKLDSIWSALVCEGAEWVNEGDKHTCARKHLEYLLHWGINGGLTNGYEGMSAYGISLLTEIKRTEKGCKVLLLGSEEDIRELQNAYPYIESQMREQDFRWLDYNTASQNWELRKKRWDLLLLIEPDVYASDSEKQLIKDMAAVSAACKIAFFAKKPCADEQMYNWLAGLLGYSDNPSLIDYLVRDNRDPKPLPEKHAFCPSGIEKAQPVLKPNNEPVFVRPLTEGGAELTLPGKEETGTSIPVRSEVRVNQDSSWITCTATENLYKSFFDEARKLAEYVEDKAEHSPFSCYWPKYSDMDSSQKKWYFYLRGCIRKGEYPDTDLSYLFVYIYEILNLIGIHSAREGYQILLKIQKAYGLKYPSLRRYLTEWIYDFIHVYDCGISLKKLQTDLPELPEQGLNELLLEMSAGDTFILPLWALERLSQYKITNSKFYQRNNQELMDRCIPGALNEIDKQLRKKGKGVLDTYAALKIHNDSFTAFNGALVETALVYRIRCRHYHNGLKFCGYLKNVIRYTENVLRTQLKFSAKLQGINLDDRSRKWIEAFVAEQTKAEAHVLPEKKVEARISLDLKKLDQLRADSDDVREALIASMSGERNETVPSIEIVRPEGTAEGLLTDLVPVQNILSRLSPEHRNLIDKLAQHDWTADVHVLHEGLTGLILEALAEEINEIAMMYLGCFLLEREEESFVVAEDYRDELEFLMAKEEKSSDAWQLDWDGMEEDWKAFFEQANVVVIGKILEGMDVFYEYAKARGEMPDLLLDELNNTSSDTIGDLIVDDNGIFEDYLPIIQKHFRKG